MEGGYIAIIDIPSYYIEDDYLPVFLVYHVGDNEAIKKRCPEYEPSQKEGIHTGISLERKGGQWLISASKKQKEINPEKSLECLSGLYSIYINDSLIENPQFYFKQNPGNNEKGIFTLIDIKNLVRGENGLRVDKYSLTKEDSLTLEEYVSLPFWKE